MDDPYNWSRQCETWLEWFFEHLVPCVTGKGEWRKYQKRKVLSEIVSPTDEAFAMLVLENKHATWLPQDKNNVPAPKYTSGNRTKDSSGKYEGWNVCGLTRFNELTKKARASRNETKRCNWEYDFMKRIAQRGTKKSGQEYIGYFENGNELNIEMDFGFGLDTEGNEQSPTEEEEDTPQVGTHGFNEEDVTQRASA